MALVLAVLILAGAGPAGAGPGPEPAGSLRPALEAAIQFALESLESGLTARSSGVGGLEEIANVRPERTWKSVTGDWCREFAIWFETGGERSRESIAIRCRDEAGVWQPVRKVENE